MMLDFNFSERLKDGELFLENQRLSDCRITGIRSEDVRFVSCVFENVIFDNRFERNIVMMEECRFINCEFHDTFCGAAISLAIMDNSFENCLFENIGFYGSNEQSEIVESKFWNCNFKYIQIKGDMNFIGLKMEHGKIEHLYYDGGEILGNQFTNIQMSDITLRASAVKNKMEKIIFKNVLLMGADRQNKFIDCDTSGFTFREEL